MKRDRAGNRPSTTNGETSPVSIVAFHEAGHAVVAWLAFRDMARAPAPVAVTSVEIDVGDTLRSETERRLGVCHSALSRMTWSMLEWDIVVNFAGGLAEAIHRGERNRRSALRIALAKCGMGIDLEAIKRRIAALRILTDFPDDDDDRDAHRRFAWQALALLKANWVAVEAIAAALIERRKLDGAEVEAIINEVAHKKVRTKS